MVGRVEAGRLVVVLEEVRGWYGLSVVGWGGGQSRQIGKLRGDWRGRSVGGWLGGGVWWKNEGGKGTAEGSIAGWTEKREGQTVGLRLRKSELVVTSEI